MTDSTKSGETAALGCPECGARVKPTDAKCWLCGRELVLTADVVEESSQSPFAASWSPRVGVQPRPFQFSLESLLLVITLAAVRSRKRE